MYFSLRICAGKHAGREFPIQGPRFLIGGADTCHLKIRAAQISPYHCAMLVQGDGLWVQDLGGGVLVGGTRVVGRSRLHRGDQLQIGSLHFEVLVQEAPANGRRPAPGEGEILDILSEPVERPAAPAPEPGGFSDARSESAKFPPTTRAAPSARPTPAEAGGLAGDVLQNLYHPPKVKLVKFKAISPEHAITPPAESPPEDDVELPPPVPPHAAPEPAAARRQIVLPRWLFIRDGELNPNVIFVLGIWAGIGLSAAAVALWRTFGR